MGELQEKSVSEVSVAVNTHSTETTIYTSDTRLNEALAGVKRLLAPNEKLDAYSVERVFFPVRDAVVTTLLPGLIGGAIASASKPTSGFFFALLSIMSITIVLALIQFRTLRRRGIVAVTSNRFLFMNRKLFGGYNLTEIKWQDFKEARISMGIFSADIDVKYYVGHDRTSVAAMHELKCRYLAKDSSQEIYRLTQVQEQAWREKRRLREIEESRAASGGFQVPVQSGQSEDATAKLEKAKAMLDKGLISVAEYETLKAKFIDAL